MKLFRLPLLLLASALAASAATIVVEEIIAKVNGDIILRSDYEGFATEIAGELSRNERLTEEEKREQAEARQQNVLRDLIDERLLVQRGEELGVAVEGQVLRQRDQLMEQYNLATIEEFEQWTITRAGMPAEDLLDRMREQFLSQAVLGQEVGSRISITAEEIEAYYKEHEADFVRSEGVRLAEILVAREGLSAAEFEKQAKEVADRVQKGEPFAEMAKRFSASESSKDVGGDIGIFRRGVLQKEIEEQVFDKNPGFITDLIKVSRGYLLLKVIEKHREGLAGLEEVQEEIRNTLTTPRYGPAVREFLTFLREDAYIEIRPGYLDSSAVAGKDTSWSDPAKLAPITTTREEILNKRRKRRLLWVFPLPEKDRSEEADEPDDSSSEINPVGSTE